MVDLSHVLSTREKADRLDTAQAMCEVRCSVSVDGRTLENEQRAAKRVDVSGVREGGEKQTSTYQMGSHTLPGDYGIRWEM